MAVDSTKLVEEMRNGIVMPSLPEPPLWRTMRGELPEHGTKVIVAFLRPDLTYRKRLCFLNSNGEWSKAKSKETAVYWMPLPNDPPFPIECRPARKNFLKRIFKTI